MQKLKKAAAVAVMVGGLGLVGGGVASAHGGHDYDDIPFAANNLQIVDCEQNFDGADIGLGGIGAVTGDNNVNTGNFCTVIGSIDD
ncbi:hypothetical protein [Streptomyces cellulosae]|uniref:Secreted protein n=1 Tax=Streptomyces cellulosae TaxID=1968 RepID=A0ABW7Y7T0_STRCE